METTAERVTRRAALVLVVLYAGVLLVYAIDWWRIPEWVLELIPGIILALFGPTIAGRWRRRKERGGAPLDRP